MAGFIQLHRTEPTELLLRSPNAFALLTLIALRARRDVPQINPHGLQIGEAMLGDHAAAGLSRQEFRSAISNLQKWSLVTIRATNKGTIAKLSDTSIYDINSQACNQQVNQPATIKSTSQQPASNQPATTNNKERKKEGEEPSSLRSDGAAVAAPSKRARAGKDYASTDVTTYHLPAWSTQQFAAEFGEWLTYRQAHRSGKLLRTSVDKMLNELRDYNEAFCSQLFQHAIKNGNQGLTFDNTAERFAAFQLGRPGQRPATPDPETDRLRAFTEEQAAQPAPVMVYRSAPNKPAHLQTNP